MHQVEPSVVWHEHDCACRACEPQILTVTPADGVTKWFRARAVVEHRKKPSPRDALFAVLDRNMEQRTGDDPV